MSHCVELFKALADPTRLRILNLLRRREICVCQIVDVLGLGQSKRSTAWGRLAVRAASRRARRFRHLLVQQGFESSSKATAAPFRFIPQAVEDGTDSLKAEA